MGEIDAPNSRCTTRCTSEPETPHADPVATLSALLLGLSAADRARLAALLVGSPSPSPADDFGKRFDAAFARLDQAAGGHNFVSLVALRVAIADVPRDAFDAGLQTLRLARRYTLSGAEGRHGLMPEERAAGIVENGALLLYVSLRT